MLDLLVTFLCGAVIAACLYFYIKLKRPPGFPPGPAVYPILGSLPTLDVDYSAEDNGLQLIKALNKKSQKYGPIYGLAAGHRWVVVIHNFPLMKEAFLSTASAGRPDPGPVLRVWNPFAPALGILDGSYEDQWKLQRHTALQVLRSLGYGRSITEACIHEEADIMIEKIKSTEGKATDISDLIGHAVANVIVNLLTGERYDYEDKGFKEVRHNLDTGFEGIQKTVVLSRIPGGTWLPSYKRDVKAAEEAFAVVHKFMHKKLADNKLDEGVTEPRNFLEGYQLEREKNPKLEDRLFQIFMDLMLAGMETTTTTLGWSIFFMVTNQEVQKKVQKELDQVVGRGRQPKLSDRSSLPYTSATLNEILRLAATVPIVVPHRTLTTCQIGGFTIPPDTEIWPIVWDVLRDPKIWPDPLELKPERFLDDEGNVKTIEEFIPFGIGRRSCLGEQLAKQELFIFFSNLLQSFTFSPPDGSEMKHVTEGLVSVTHKPPAYKVVATRRN